ncbi:uncharacterized protein [Amphiura filiformis]|uniref:uncharacterized protein n=1 Tax=Amphiura filiformis TaxID=82378 RepID=UPI003B220DBA
MPEQQPEQCEYRPINHDQRISYSRDQLLAIQPARLTKDLVTQLRSLEIGTGLPRKRYHRKSGKPDQINRDHLKWMCFNVQSCRQIATDISEIISDNDLDILMLTETWLYAEGDEAYESAMTPHGYDSYSFPRSGKRGGGIAFIIRSALSKNVKFTALTYTTFESVEMKLSINQLSATSICLYRLHHNKKDEVTFPNFLSEFTDMLSSYADSNCDLSFMGDFNLHYDDLINDRQVQRVNCVLLDFGLKQLVDKPTHIKKRILDWVVVRNENSLITFNDVNVYPGKSDHFAVLGHVAISRPAPVKRLVTSRNLRAVKLDNLKMDLAALTSSICEKVPNSDIVGLVDSYNDGLRQVLDRHAPLQTRSVRDRPSAPWLTAEVRDARRSRRRAERLWRKTKLTVHKEMYINMRNEATQHVIAAKRQFYTAKIDSDTFSTKQLFSVSNQLLGKSRTSALPTNIPPNELQERFCQFFSNKIINLREELDSRHSLPPSFSVYEGPVFDQFTLVSEDEISDLIKSMPTKGCILDPLPTDLVKQCADDLVPLLTCIINESLASGIVPDQFKQAIIVPILKKNGLDFILATVLSVWLYQQLSLLLFPNEQIQEQRGRTCVGKLVQNIMPDKLIPLLPNVLQSSKV